MHFIQVMCAIFFLVGAVSAKGFRGGGGFDSAYGSSGYGGGHDSAYGYGGYGGGHGSAAPKPYDFGYVAGNIGGSHFRSEKGDSSGKVQGAYGYTDNQGLYRKVEYVADGGGFHASVKTNEPGTDGKENPADVQMNVEPAPHGIQDKYSSGYSSHGIGSGGYADFGGAGLFSGIPRSSSGKSGY